MLRVLVIDSVGLASNCGRSVFFSHSIDVQCCRLTREDPAAVRTRFGSRFRHPRRRRPRARPRRHPLHYHRRPRPLSLSTSHSRSDP